jgi:formylglycine-generating enzyme required for sulfatase activity
MAKYPVTNEQYRRFWDDAGYETDKPWWDAKAEKELDDAWGETWRHGPRYWDDKRFNRPTFPVVGVSWYEAVAYCAWLTAKLRSKGVIPESHEVRLPTQEEWERAVRGRHGQEYPWGDDTFNASRANTKESDLGTTTPVHMYASGATPPSPGSGQADGIWDLSGNVWEWTSDPHKRRRNASYLIGGSWFNEGRSATASAAVDFNLRHRLDHNGFRVVVAPISF